MTPEEMRKSKHYGGMLMLGVLLFTGFMAVGEIRLSCFSEIGNGVVTSSGASRRAFVVSFEFTTQDGRTFANHCQPSMADRNKYPPGTPVQVEYMLRTPGREGDARIVGTGRTWIVYLFAACFAASVIAMVKFYIPHGRAPRDGVQRS